jgi:hypothetical protein
VASLLEAMIRVTLHHRKEVVEVFWQFSCPISGVSLVALVPQEAVDADAELHIPCVRGSRPAGCGETHVYKPSQGFRVR